MADIANFLELRGDRRYERYSRDIYIFKKESSGQGEVADILKIAGIQDISGYTSTSEDV